MCSNMLNAFFGAAVPASIGVRIGASPDLLHPLPSGWELDEKSVTTQRGEVEQFSEMLLSGTALGHGHLSRVPHPYGQCLWL